MNAKPLFPYLRSTAFLDHIPVIRARSAALKNNEYSNGNGNGKSLVPSLILASQRSELWGHRCDLSKVQAAHDVFF